MASGEDVPLNRMRFGNLIVRGAPLRALPGPFDVNFRLASGEDADVLIRLVRAGSRVVWCDEAVVTEPIEKARLSLDWLLRRALSGGQEFARKTLTGNYGEVTLRRRLGLLVRSIASLSVASLATAAFLPFGRHRAAKWLVKASANLGKLSIFWGWRYQEYARAP
jgi:succinoglycan biosynthesis protein ExoM